MSKELDVKLRAKDYFGKKYKLEFIESCGFDYFAEILMSLFYRLDNFEELVENEQLFYVELERPTEFEDKKDIIKELKIVTNHIHKKIAQRPFSIFNLFSKKTKQEIKH